MDLTTDTLLRELYESLDERRRPETVGRALLALQGLSNEVHAKLLPIAAHADRVSFMSEDFHRSFASLQPQLNVAATLYAIAAPVDAADLDAVAQYVAEIERPIGKQPGRNDYKHDRLNKEQREKGGIDLSRRQYNKRFRLAVKMED
jgi:hypothetical protein